MIKSVFHSWTKFSLLCFFHFLLNRIELLGIRRRFVPRNKLVHLNYVIFTCYARGSWMVGGFKCWSLWSKFVIGNCMNWSMISSKFFLFYNVFFWKGSQLSCFLLTKSRRWILSSIVHVEGFASLGTPVSTLFTMSTFANFYFSPSSICWKHSRQTAV